MHWVRTLLAVWLTLAVPAAGVAAASTNPDCSDHVEAHAGAAHGGHGSHGAASPPPADTPEQCDCECGPLHCGFALSAAASGTQEAHVVPRSRTAGSRGTGELPPPLPDGLFRPPISA